MSCNHVNPPGYAFCGTCGRALDNPRCRCGFVGSAGDVFCGRCGTDISKAPASDALPIVDGDQRFDLESMVRQAANEKQFLESTHKAHVTQDDIRKLLTKRRKKF